jgi:hypothetical protein
MTATATGRPADRSFAAGRPALAPDPGRLLHADITPWVATADARQVAGPKQATQVAGVVADDLRLVQVPQPESARLMDVVDERLPVHGPPG